MFVYLISRHIVAQSLTQTLTEMNASIDQSQTKLYRT